MEEWKIRQDIYHRLQKEHKDDLNEIEYEMTDNVLEHAVDYFVTPNKGWVYPSKSYMVGICYARWLAEEFGGDMYVYLDDEELLYGNDPFFKTYSEDKEMYDAILNIIGEDFDETKGMVPDVREYFVQEFMI